MSQKTHAVPPPLDARTQAKLRAAFHEAGRFIAAKHFKVAEVSGLHPLAKGARFAGKTIYSPTSPFNEAVIGWAGALAEMVFAHQPDKWEVIRQTAWEMFAENMLSKADSDLIASLKEKRKTFNAAAKIIKDNFDQTKDAALNLARFDSIHNFP